MSELRTHKQAQFTQHIADYTAYILANRYKYEGQRSWNSLHVEQQTEKNWGSFSKANGCFIF